MPRALLTVPVLVLVAGLLVGCTCALAGVGEATSEPTFIDTRFPSLELAPVPDHLLLQAGQQYSFSWTSDDLNPGLSPDDYMARILVVETPVDSTSWFPAGETNQWDWTVGEIQSAQCRLEVSVRDIMGNTTTQRSQPFTVLLSTSDIPLPGPVTALDAPYPNPFNPSCGISFTLASGGTMELSVHDLRGRRLKTLQRGRLGAGKHTMRWDGTDHLGHPQPGGVYFFILDVQEAGRAGRHVQRAILLP